MAGASLPGPTDGAAGAIPAAASPNPAAAILDKLRFQAVLRRLDNDALQAPATPASSGSGASQATAGAPQGGGMDPITQFKLQSLQKATAEARQQDFQSAMRIVAEVSRRLGKEDPFVDELRGTVLVMKKDYSGGEASFRKMAGKLPNSITARFNLAETIFLQRRYAEAESGFADLDSLERDKDPALADLCRFKRMMCLLAAGSTDSAVKLLPAKDDPSAGSPAMRYGTAAICYVKKDYSSADAIIAGVRQELGQDVENLFADSFIELKWGGRDGAGDFHVIPAEAANSQN